MNGDDFKQVRQGDPLEIRARTWNKVLEVTQRDQLHRLDNHGGNTAINVDPDIIIIKCPGSYATARGSIVVPVKGNFSADTNALSANFACSVDQYRERPIFQCAGSDPNYTGYFAITLEDIPSQKYGRAQIHGVATVIVDIKNIKHEYADIDPTLNPNTSSTNLVSAMGGYAKILSPSIGSGATTLGTQWCTVLLGAEQKTFTAAVGVAWSSNNPNLLRVAAGLSPGAAGGANTNTINLALYSPITSEVPCIPCDVAVGTAIQYIPSQGPRASQGTNKIDGIALPVNAPGGLYMVTLAQTAGGGGGPGPASWQYTMSSFGNGQTLKTNVSPQARTHAPGTNAASAATLGIGYLNAGNWALAIAFES